MKWIRFVFIGALIAGYTSGCTTTRAGSGSGKQAYSFALIGDMPYSPRDLPRFERLVREINNETNLEWVLHAGDIKTGNAPCTDEYLAGRLALFQQFEMPFVLVPGDNEWTDCHREGAGGYQPLERLQKLRALFYPEPGRSLGRKTLQMETQASNPSYVEFPEHVRWVQNGVVLAGLHVVGSRNAMAPFTGRTEADDLESARRMEAAIQWMQDAFKLAHQINSPGIFLMMHANPGFGEGTGQQVFGAFLETLEQESVQFGKPVILVHGDSHYFRIDKPLISSYSNQRIENFTRVETFGAGDVHWLRVTVDPDDENVFIFKQEIVQENRLQHVPPN